MELFIEKAAKSSEQAARDRKLFKVPDVHLVALRARYEEPDAVAQLGSGLKVSLVYGRSELGSPKTSLIDKRRK